VSRWFWAVVAMGLGLCVTAIALDVYRYTWHALAIVTDGIGLGLFGGTLVSHRTMSFFKRRYDEASKAGRAALEREQRLCDLILFGARHPGEAGFQHFMHFVASCQIAKGQKLTVAEVEILTGRYAKKLHECDLLVGTGAGADMN